MSAGFYVLRYVPEATMRERKHALTLGRFETWADADDARLLSPAATVLEVQGPRGQS